MKIQDIIQNIELVTVKGNNQINVLAIESDSRQVNNGCMFVALPGTKIDGHNFIDQAIIDGAVAIVCQSLPGKISSHVTYIQVRSTALSLGKLLSNFHRDPSSKLKIIGLT